MESTNRWIIFTLLVGEASGVFAGFCPSWFTVASPFFHEQEARAGNIKRIRWGEVAATTIVMATGVAISINEKDPAYVIASAVICGIFVAGYEYQIANPSSKDADGAGTSASAWLRIGKSS